MLKPKKNLGQNFLIDQIVLYRILEAVNPKKEDKFLEIGAGKGALTKELIRKVETIESVEIDKDLIPHLKKLKLISPEFKVHEDSILNLELNKLTQGKFKFRVIGNLPYNLSSQIMLWSFKNSANILDLHYMFQREFGERLVSSPGEKSYGRLTVLSQYLFDSLGLFEVDPESFNPKPAVESIFIKFKPKLERDFNSKEALKLQELTQLMFSKRRKMISTSCKGLISPNDFINLGINPENRPESLSINDFIKITKYLLNNKNG